MFSTQNTFPPPTASKDGLYKGRRRYALRRRRGLWLVVFDGEEAQFKHEKGAEYVARLLTERGPFHALDLASKTGGGGTVQVRNAEFKGGP